MHSQSVSPPFYSINRWSSQSSNDKTLNSANLFLICLLSYILKCECWWFNCSSFWVTPIKTVHTQFTSTKKAWQWQSWRYSTSVFWLTYRVDSSWTSLIGLSVTLDSSQRTGSFRHLLPLNTQNTIIKVEEAFGLRPRDKNKHWYVCENAFEDRTAH